MSDREPMASGSPATGGIFTPWDQILARLERQYEAILTKLDSKMDVGSFQQFQANYETRHERLQSELSNFVKEAHSRWEALDKSQQAKELETDRRLSLEEQRGERYIPILENAVKRIDSLEDDRLSRDAVKRVLYVGGPLVGAIAAINLIINLIQGGSSVP